MYQRWWVIQMTTNASGLSLLPAMDVRHMHIQIPHMGERMIGHWTPSNPAIVWTFPIRVLSTIWLVLTPCHFYLKGFPTKRANKTAWGNHRISPMLGLVVLMHGVSTSKLFLTHRACNPLTLHTQLCVLCPVPSSCQYFPTLTTWELLTPVDTHMYSHSVVGLEDLLTHWAGCLSPRDGWNLIGHLSYLPGLCPLWQIFTLKKGQHLLLHTLQGPLLYHHFILSYLGLHQNQNRFCLQSSRSTRTTSGHSRCSLQTLSLVLAGYAYTSFLLSVRRM